MIQNSPPGFGSEAGLMSVLETIRIDLGAEISGPGPGAGRRHGIFEYSCVRYPRVRGYSRQPLLDACRKLKALCGLTGERVGLFRKGRSEVGPVLRGAAEVPARHPDATPPAKCLFAFS